MEFMRLRKEVGQSGVGSFWWEKNGDVVRVPWSLGEELLGLKGAGFSQVLDSDPDVQSEYDPGLPGDVPEGTPLQVLEWVGVDSARAAAALKAELDRGSESRRSLVAKLEKLV